MTGKEALEKLLDSLKHWQGRNTIFDKIHSRHILDELELLEKYKLAFEIFKGKEVNVYSKFDGNTQYIITLNKNEYELLEELMSDA